MLLALLLCYAGFTALCLSMPRHHDELLGHKPSAARRQALKLGGVVVAVFVAVGGGDAKWLESRPGRVVRGADAQRIDAGVVAAVSPASGFGAGGLESVGQPGRGMGAVLTC